MPRRGGPGGAVLSAGRQERFLILQGPESGSIGGLLRVFTLIVFGRSRELWYKWKM
jgi:hypothetical protein